MNNSNHLLVVAHHPMKLLDCGNLRYMVIKALLITNVGLIYHGFVYDNMHDEHAMVL